MEEQTKEINGLGITLVHSKPSSEDCLKDISKGKFQMMFASAEDCLCKKFTEILKAPEPHSEYNISLIVIYECHTVETWQIKCCSEFVFDPTHTSDLYPSRYQCTYQLTFIY